MRRCQTIPISAVSACRQSKCKSKTQSKTQSEESADEGTSERCGEKAGDEQKKDSETLGVCAAQKRVAIKAEWWFQSYKRRTPAGYIEGYKRIDLDKAADLLRALPSRTQVGTANLNFTTVSQNNSPMIKFSVRTRLHVFGAKSWILGIAKTRLLDTISEQSITELIDEVADELDEI